MIHIVEEIIQDIYAFYNKSAKRRCRLKELAQNADKVKMEDKAIETLENTIEKTIKKGISFYKLFI